MKFCIVNILKYMYEIFDFMNAIGIGLTRKKQMNDLKIKSNFILLINQTINYVFFLN